MPSSLISRIFSQISPGKPAPMVARSFQASPAPDIQPEILEADRKREESFKNFDLAAFAKKTFGMYGGVDVEVTLECRNELAGVVIDRFGHDVWMCPHGEDHFRARVPVAVSS